jgi:hypothetical protein
MSSFVPLKRTEPVNEKKRAENEAEEDDSSSSFTMLSSQDKQPSFSYAFERINKQFRSESLGTDPTITDNDAFQPLARALSFAHRGLGIESCRIEASSSQSENSLARKSAGVVCVVDTFSTGALIVDSLIKQGYGVIRVLSGDLNPDLLDMVLAGLATTFEGTVTLNTNIGSFDESLVDLVAQINRIVVEEGKVTSSLIAAVIAGAETGVELADALSEKLGIRTNGTHLSEARRNKYVMGETIRAAGLRAVKQLKASSWEEVENFLDAWKPDPFKVIVKPLDSAGSDGVTLCLSRDEVSITFTPLSAGDLLSLSSCRCIARSISSSAKSMAWDTSTAISLYRSILMVKNTWSTSSAGMVCTRWLRSGKLPCSSTVCD